MLKREAALDHLEELAYNAVLRMAKLLESDETLPVGGIYIKAIKEAHAIITNGLKNAGGDGDGDESPESLLLRLNEMTERLKKKIRRQQESQRVVALLKNEDDDDIFGVRDERKLDS